MDINELIARHPRLYHMAHCGSWESIQRHGLLSTEALLDKWGIKNPQRQTLLDQRRPEIVRIESIHGSAYIRDQKPMYDHLLKRCLLDGLTPIDWYRILNSRVFFWVSEARLKRLLNARAYRHQEQDIIVIDTAKLVGKHYSEVSLCPINSGATMPGQQKRGLNSFLRIPDYPYDAWLIKRGASGDPLVELTVDYAVPDVRDFVVEAFRRNSKGLTRLF